MTFEARELSQDSGAPIRYVTFDRAGIIWRYTTAETDQTFQSNLYKAIKGFGHSALEQNSENISMQLTFTLPRDAVVAQAFIRPSGQAPMQVTMWANHRGEADSEALPIWSGVVSSVTFSGSTLQILCSALASAYSREIGAHTQQRACPNMLYGVLCGVVKATHTFDATVTVVSADGFTVTVTDPADLGSTPSRYAGGILTWGARSAEIVSEGAAGVFTLQVPMADLPVGLVIQVTRGCDRKPTTCDTVFSNQARYGGFRMIPLRNIWRRTQ